MDAASWGFIGAIAGTVVGAAASICTTILNGRNASELQKHADALERTERARAFQRDNLLELQEAVMTSMRFMNSAHHEDMLADKKGVEWGKSMLSDEVNQGAMMANGRLVILTERVANEELRENLKKLRLAITSCMLSRSKQESLDELNRATSEFESVMEKLGIVLRTYY